MIPADPLLHMRVGPYRIESVLGAGGMGRVYAATNATAGTRVAIKVIAQQYAADRELLDRFFTEARAVNLVKHENIVAVYDLDRLADGRPYIVMELVEGTSLRKHPLATTPLPQLLAWFQQVLAGIGAAHERGIVHRDLKPDNVIVSTSGRAKVLDFGIAKLTNAGKTLAPRTATGMVLGTPEYMAPEQIQGGVAEPRSDLYAVGVMLYELVAGRRPFAGKSDFEIMLAHTEAVPVPPSQYRPDLPPALEQVILKALAKHPDGRFTTAADMARALKAVVAGPVRATPAPRSHRGLLAAMAAVLCVGLGVGILIAQRGRSAASGRGDGAIDFDAELAAQRAIAERELPGARFVSLTVASVDGAGAVHLRGASDAVTTMWTAGDLDDAHPSCSLLIYIDPTGRRTIRHSDPCLGLVAASSCVLPDVRAALATQHPELATTPGTLTYLVETWMFIEGTGPAIVIDHPPCEHAPADGGIPRRQ